jgi:hypothetical protein
MELADSPDSLSVMAALERRYDGPVPEPLRQVARVGSADRRLLFDAEGQSDFFAALIRGQIEAIRRARRDGAIPARLFADLKLYRRQELWWRGEVQRLRAAVATRLAGDAP